MKSIKIFKNILFGITLILFNSLAFIANAQSNQNNIVGEWRTIDDETGKTKAIVRITVGKGVYRGRIIKLLNPSVPNPVCDKCKGDRANQPITGMLIIENITKKKNSWSGGTILDPQKGKTYRVKFTLKEGGSKLKVRGYIGIPTIGRTQTWERV